MKITRKQLLALWKIRLDALASRKPGWILNNIWFPLLFFILPWAETDFKKDYAIKYLIIYFIVLSIGLAIYACLQLMKGRLRNRKNSKLISLLLYIVYDLIMLTWFSFALLETGILGLNSFTGFTNEDFNNLKFFIFFAFLLVSTFTFFLSPQLLVWKINFSLKQAKITPGKILAIIMAVPSISVIIASMLRLTGGTSIGVVLSSTYIIFVSLLTMGFDIMHIYELWLFLKNRWPKVRKLESTAYDVFD